MSVHSPSTQAWSQPRTMLYIDRALTELRRGRGLRVRSAQGGDWLFLAVECLTPDAWQALQQLPGDWQLFLSAQRASTLGVDLAGDGARLERSGHELPFGLALPRGETLNQLGRWAGLDVQADAAQPEGSRLQPQPGHRAAAAALALARQGRLAPAVIGLALPAGDFGAEAPQVSLPWLADLLQIEAEPVIEHARLRPVQLQQISTAPVPLADDADSRFVLFRELNSDFEHVAVIVANPALDGETPVRVRLHSSCLTGDLFGSLRCDCGDQLRGTVARLAASGGGIVLYLSQEGRGIGLANKLRAYVRQDQGLDTLDANHALGFRMDERHFEVAAAMLQALGCRRINLLTNNPAKIAALRGAGIDVLDREAVLGEVNPHNQRYLFTKLRRGGHLFDEDSLQDDPQAS